MYRKETEYGNKYEEIKARRKKYKADKTNIRKILQTPKGATFFGYYFFIQIFYLFLNDLDILLYMKLNLH